MAQDSAKGYRTANDLYIQELAKDPANQLCADCGAKGPRWASYTLGVFLCIRCGGLHRRIGTHISRIKSITLDSWSTEQVDFMKAWGNTRANAKYFPQPELFTIPSHSEGEMEQFIREKYEKKLYMEPSACKSKFKIASQDIVRVVSTSPTASNEFQHALNTLKSMGFADDARNMDLLKRHKGNMAAVVEELVATSAASKPPVSPPVAPQAAAPISLEKPTAPIAAANIVQQNPVQQKATSTVQNDLLSLVDFNSPASSAQPAKDVKSNILALYGNASQVHPSQNNGMPSIYGNQAPHLPMMTVPQNNPFIQGNQQPRVPPYAAQPMPYGQFPQQGQFLQQVQQHNPFQAVQQQPQQQGFFGPFAQGNSNPTWPQ